MAKNILLVWVKPQLLGHIMSVFEFTLSSFCVSVDYSSINHNRRVTNVCRTEEVHFGLKAWNKSKMVCLCFNPKISPYFLRNKIKVGNVWPWWFIQGHSRINEQTETLVTITGSTMFPWRERGDSGSSASEQKNHSSETK